LLGRIAVGASCAEYIAIKEFCYSEVVVLDIKEGFAERPGPWI